MYSLISDEIQAKPGRDYYDEMDDADEQLFCSFCMLISHFSCVTSYDHSIHF